jgi:hypothetical protein
MNNFIKQTIDEAFASKKQQRYFYAKARDKSLSPKERRQWKKWAKEFADKTNFKKLPERAEEQEMDEIVDDEGNITKSKKPKDYISKYTVSKSTNDKLVHTAYGSMGSWGIMGGGVSRNPIRYWTEADMSKALGADETIMKADVDYDEAKEYFEDELEIPEDEAEERIEKMGYDENLPEDKIRLVENPQKFIEEYIESLLSKRDRDSEIVEKDTNIEINPIIKKQIDALKETLKNNNISIDLLLQYLKNNE